MKIETFLSWRLIGLGCMYLPTIFHAPEQQWKRLGIWHNFSIYQISNLQSHWGFKKICFWLFVISGLQMFYYQKHDFRSLFLLDLNPANLMIFTHFIWLLNCTHCLIMKSDCCCRWFFWVRECDFGKEKMKKIILSNKWTHHLTFSWTGLDLCIDLRINAFFKLRLKTMCMDKTCWLVQDLCIGLRIININFSFPK